MSSPYCAGLADFWLQDYPNNVQELFSMIENAWAHLADGDTLTADMLWTAQSPKKLDMFKDGMGGV